MAAIAVAVMLLLTSQTRADSVTAGTVVVFFDGTSAGRADWVAAVNAFASFDEFRIEDFNGLPTEASLSGIVPGAVGFGAGPGSFGGGDVGFAFSDVTMPPDGIAAGGDDTFVGGGSSQIGVIAGGEHEGSNAYGIRSVADAADFILLPGILDLPIPGEGVESLDFTFNVPVFAFGAAFNSVSTDDGLEINVNGQAINVHDIYPDDTLQDGDGFVGVLDVGGISSFSFHEAGNDDLSSGEDFEMDDFEYALVQTTPLVPLPASAWMGLALLGAVALVGAVRRLGRSRLVA